MRKIGLLGGTFDPPHIGHLIIGEEVYQKLKLDEIWFIPSSVPPHKDTTTTEPEHRKEMVDLSIRENPHFRLETFELEREGRSYTVDTIKALQSSHPDDEFFFIIGADMVEYLPKWHKIDELMGMVQFVGVAREGYSLASAYSITEVEIPMIEISSTEIRKRLDAGNPVYYWILNEVLDYIREQELYGFK
ncbi:nicotinate-nucleotide adenylyltransferase [Salinibacillus xinjiangensis]|uniref:Probable nicotinate-nucleotide adenylyltransferase n=1 Tax=Salinibacillus xinjiangensis TaxID=1229268 RepID=A0A6G1X6R9_9BACI|nr:nicotinate-nucleotide adenylyltransferase [Salinibacillus xinjiangensis]MRG86664.1 nicotinate-nucleotide adenylyltransferase [Salinibacillus xinjiangensis]